MGHGLLLLSLLSMQHASALPHVCVCVCVAATGNGDCDANCNCSCICNCRASLVSAALSLYLFHLCAATGNKNTRNKRRATHSITLWQTAAGAGAVRQGRGVPTQLANQLALQFMPRAEGAPWHLKDTFADTLTPAIQAQLNRCSGRGGRWDRQERSSGLAGKDQWISWSGSGCGNKGAAQTVRFQLLLLYDLFRCHFFIFSLLQKKG